MYIDIIWILLSDDEVQITVFFYLFLNSGKKTFINKVDAENEYSTRSINIYPKTQNTCLNQRLCDIFSEGRHNYFTVYLKMITWWLKHVLLKKKMQNKKFFSELNYRYINFLRNRWKKNWQSNWNPSRYFTSVAWLLCRMSILKITYDKGIKIYFDSFVVSN